MHFIDRDRFGLAEQGVLCQADVAAGVPLREQERPVPDEASRAGKTALVATAVIQERHRHRHGQQ